MSGTDKVSQTPMDNLSSASSMIADVTRPDVGKTPVDGAARLPSPEHKDAKLARLADQSGYTSVGHDASNPAVLESRAAGAFLSSTQLEAGEDA